MKKTITYLITAAAFLLVSIGAEAQGGLTPLVGSTHDYTVTAESTGNTLAWTVTGGIAGTDFTINSGAATEQVNITWLSTGTFTITFTETDATTLCETVKEATVVVGANTFDVSTTSPTATCNAADGQINYGSATATTSITFTVDMTTANTGFSPDWEIDFTLTPGTGATIGNLTVGEGTLSGPGPYNLSDISSTDGDGTVTITMDVTGSIYTALDVDFEITAAKELTYDTPDVDSDDWTATQDINAIPNTSTITTD